MSNDRGDAPNPQHLTATNWATESAARWEAVADHVEEQLQPVAHLLADAAAIQPGEIVLDIGCGRGVTTRDAAVAAGPRGLVVGVDVASNLIDHARSAPAEGAPIEWIVADAQMHSFSSRFDAVISRFGVMFFDDPVVAMTNLHRATNTGGRLCVAVWQSRDRAEVLSRPLGVAVATAADAGFPIDVPSPYEGAHSWSDGAYVRGLLGEAGWRDVTFTRHELDVYAFGSGPVEALVDRTLAMGPVYRALVDAPAEVIERVRAALEADLRRDHDGTGVRMGAAVAIVGATA